MFDLYLITDRKLLPGGALVDTLALALRGSRPGRIGVQLREKELEGGPLERLARSMQRVCEEAGAPMLVNGRADVARAVGASGVHLPKDGLPCADLRAWWPEALLGASAHSGPELDAAFQAGADFATLGPIWATPSKASYGPPLGEGALSLRRPTHKAVFALGGVTVERAPRAITAGADGLGCIRAVLCAKDPGQAVSELLRAIDLARGRRT